MQKTYWWRVSFLILGIIMFGYSYVVSYSNNLGLCEVNKGVEKCVFEYNSYIDAFGFSSVSIIIIAIILLFISDKIFLKWLHFAVVWIVLSIIAIVVTPEYAGTGVLSGPNREMVSIWMGSLFVIISLIKIIWDSKQKKLKN